MVSSGPQDTPATGNSAAASDFRSTASSTEYQFPHASENPLLQALREERECRYRAEAELAVARAELAQTQARLAATEKDLAELRGRHWTSHMMKAAEEMGPGGALIATVGVPVMAAPLAVATVVKGFQSVGYGIGGLFSRKGKEEGKKANVQSPVPSSYSPAPSQSDTVGPSDFSFYNELNTGKK